MPELLELLDEVRGAVVVGFAELLEEESASGISGPWLAELEKIYLNPKPTTTKTIMISETSIGALDA